MIDVLSILILVIMLQCLCILIHHISFIVNYSPLKISMDPTPGWHANLWSIPYSWRPWCWEGLGAGGEGDYRGWDGWTASPTQWTWVWVNSGSCWWTGRPGVLRFMGSQRVRHDRATELTDWKFKRKKITSKRKSFCQCPLILFVPLVKRTSIKTIIRRQPIILCA